ncbi:nuclear transport factor 2 family protein [Antarctobacter sp.]|uniref:nuclear transport factor 2 family protein n=1 Tax=Antarctobacter sp. TaxID=1872577 RepID=UPI003A9562C0
MTETDRIAELQRRIEALDREVTRQRDCEEIRQAMYAYARGVDRADAALFEAAFHDDAYDDHGNFRGDKAQTVATLRRSGQNPEVKASMHHIGNILIDLEGNFANVESYFVAYQRREVGDRTYTRSRAGRYLDRFEKRDGRWRVLRRRVVDDWSRLDEVGQTAREVGPENTLCTRDRHDASYEMEGFAQRHIG